MSDNLHSKLQGMQDPKQRVKYRESYYEGLKSGKGVAFALGFADKQLAAPAKKGYPAGPGTPSGQKGPMATMPKKKGKR